MLRRLITTGMGRTTIKSGLIALFFPIIMIWAKRRIHSKKIWQVLQVTVLIVCVFGMIYLTLGGRESGERNINLMPFWTYHYFSNIEYRWEIYMNVFLFMPFGFLLVYVTKRNFLQSLLIGFSLSVCIEAVQYLFCLGMCEFDDVFHNTLGTMVGFGYCKVLSRIEAKHEKQIRVAGKQDKRYFWKL